MGKLGEDNYNWIFVDEDGESWKIYSTLPEARDEYVKDHDENKVVAIIRGSQQMPHL